MRGISICTVSSSRLHATQEETPLDSVFVAVPGNWLRRSQEKKRDIKEMNFQGDLRTDRQTVALVKFHLFFRRHGNWLNNVRYPSYLFLLTFILFLSSFFCANPEISPLHSFLYSVAIDEQTWNIRQLGRHLSAPSWHATCSLPFTSLSCNLWKVLGELKCRSLRNV